MSELTADQQNIRRLLERVSGIGPKISGAIWERFGETTWQTLIESPEEVTRAIRGVSQQRAEAARQLLLNADDDRARSDEQPAASTQVGSRDNANEHQPESEQLDESLMPRELRQQMDAAWERIHRQRTRAERVLDRHRQRLMILPNVTGVHVGFRRRRNASGIDCVTCDLQVCIRVHVAEKLDLDDPRFDDPRLAVPLDETLEDVPIDVFAQAYTTLDPPTELEPRSPLAGKRQLPSGYHDPIVGGVEIAMASHPNNRGTLGGVVRSPAGHRFITNMHVARSGVVTQPAIAEAEHLERFQIGRVVEALMPTAEYTTAIDCALIEPAANRRTYHFEIRELIGVQRFSQSFLGPSDVHRTTAIKVGAATDRTRGIVKSIRASVRIGNAIMPRQIFVEAVDQHPIIRGGDSGALLLTQSSDGLSYNVVGLVHARSVDGRMLIATHFQEIADHFGISI